MQEKLSQLASFRQKLFIAALKKRTRDIMITHFHSEGTNCFSLKTATEHITSH